MAKNPKDDKDDEVVEKKEKEKAGMKLKIIAGVYRREDGTYLTEGIVFEATAKEVKQLINIGQAKIADDDAELSELPEPSPL